MRRRPGRIRLAARRDLSLPVRAVNARGDVVGTSRDFVAFVAPSETAVIWDRAGNPTALPPLPGDTESFATGVNDRGDVVGTTSAGSFMNTAVIWD